MRWLHVFNRVLCRWAWVKVPAGLRVAAFSGIGLCSSGALLSHHLAPVVSDPPAPPLAAPAGAVAPVPAVPVASAPVPAAPIGMIVGPVVDWIAGPPSGHGPIIPAHGTPAPLLGAGLPAFLAMGGAAALRALCRKGRAAAGTARRTTRTSHAAPPR
jgi:hypothetical protein